MNGIKKRFSRIFSLLGAACITGIVYLYRINDNGFSYANLIRYLSDGLFTAAVFYLCFFTLIWVVDLGAFRGLKYITYSMRTFFAPGITYFDFLSQKEEKTKHKFNAVAVIGVVCLLASFLLSILYESI